MRTRSTYHCAVGLLLMCLLGSGCTHKPPSLDASQTAVTDATMQARAISPSDHADILLSLAEDGERGDLPQLLDANPDLAPALATELAAFVPAPSDLGMFGSHIVASYRVVGASVSATETRLFAHESLSTFSIMGGRLVELSGASGPVRIRISDSLEPIAIDEPGMGDSYGPSLREMMPEWALNRVSNMQWDAQALQEAAGRWAERTGDIPQLVFIEEPHHTDPHDHTPALYGLGALPLAVHGFAIEQIPAPGSTDEVPKLNETHHITASPDGRFECYSIGSGLIVHDAQLDRWLELSGPGLNGMFERCEWIGSTLVFDKADVGFSEPRPEYLTMIHVEADLASATVDRVVPVGPYTGNWSR